MSLDIKNNVEKLLFFLSQSVGGHAIYRQKHHFGIPGVRTDWRSDVRSSDYQNFSNA